MAHIITVSSSKGGAAKTTTTICLADYWAMRGVRVGLLDTDPNKSLSRWFEKGHAKGFFKGIEFRQELQDKRIIKTARQLSATSDILLIDVAGVASVSLLKAAGIADLVIIPAQPNEDDFLEAINTSGIVREAMELTGRHIPFRTLLTRAKEGTILLDHTLKQLERIKFPLFSTILHAREIYPQARFNGITPVSAKPGGDVYREIESLAEEVAAQLKDERQHQHLNAA